MDLTWGKGVASIDRWVGGLDVVWIDVESLTATHLGIKRGFGVTRRIVLSFEQLERWDNEGLYLGLSTLDVLSTSGGNGADGGATAVPLGPGTRVLLLDGRKLRLSGLRLSSADRVLTHLIVKLRWPAQRAILMPMENVLEVQAGHITAPLDPSDLLRLPHYRTDAEIEHDVWDRLYESDAISPLDLSGMRLEVSDSVAIIEGNVRARQVVADAYRLARSVPSVAGVDNRLVSDRDIELAAAGALAELDPGLSGSLTVRSHLGTLFLRGAAPSAGLVDAALRVASQVSGVQAVQNHVEVRVPAEVRPDAQPEDARLGSEGDPV